MAVRRSPRFPEPGTAASPILVSDDHVPLGSPSNPITIHVDEDSTAIAPVVGHDASRLPNKVEIEIAKLWASEPSPCITNADMRIDCIHSGALTMAIEVSKTRCSVLVCDRSRLAFCFELLHRIQCRFS